MSSISQKLEQVSFSNNFIYKLLSRLWNMTQNNNDIKDTSNKNGVLI